MISSTSEKACSSCASSTATSQPRRLPRRCVLLLVRVLLVRAVPVLAFVQVLSQLLSTLVSLRPRLVILRLELPLVVCWRLQRVDGHSGF